MLRHKDSQQLGKLYQHILIEKKMSSSKVDESFLDKLATADPGKILDPNEAEMRDAEFNKRLDARKAENPATKHNIFDVVGRTSGSNLGSRPAEINKSGTGKQLTTINGKQLKNQLELTYQTNLRTGTAALMVYGASGVGKSDIIRQMARKFAANEQREFIFWSSADDKTREAVFKNPKHYYVCSVMNAGQLAPEKLSGGIPNMFQDEPRVTERPFEEMAIWMTPGVSGMLFLDELNHADEDKLNALFSIVLEKRAGSRNLIGNRMLIVAAGNLGGGHAVTDLPGALVNRVKSFWLVIDPEDWFEWAGQAGIHPSILAFVKSDPQHNFRAEHDSSNKVDKNVGFPCPRNFERLSEALPDLFSGLDNGHFEEEAEARNMQPNSKRVTAFDILTQELFKTASGILGEVWAGYWISFIKYYAKFGNLDTLLELEPKKLASYYQSSLTDQKDFQPREVLNVLAGICHYLHSELVKAMHDLDIFDARGNLVNAFVGATPREDQGATPQQIQEYKDKMLKLITDTLNSPQASHLKKVLQALSKVASSVRNTTKVGNSELNVAEMVPMVTQKVPAGLSKEQRRILAVATMLYGKTDPLIKELHTELAQYMTDVELIKPKK